MSNPTPAQEEFAAFLDKNSRDSLDDIHPEDRHDVARERAEHSADEEDEYLAHKIDEAMRMPTMDAQTSLRLPPAAFDSGHSTGVKGVIADARSYETARRTTWKEKARAVRRSVFGLEGARQMSTSDSDGSGAEDPDEEEFIQRWRESRRRELEQEIRAPVRTRRTSPSVRMYGRLEEVDALGYLDAIEKVGRETHVVVFVYDHEVCFALKTPLAINFTDHSYYSAKYPQRLKGLLFLSLPNTLPSASSRFTTRTSSLITPQCQQYWHTATRATSLLI